MTLDYNFTAHKKKSFWKVCYLVSEKNVKETALGKNVIKCEYIRTRIQVFDLISLSFSMDIQWTLLLIDKSFV